MSTPTSAPITIFPATVGAEEAVLRVRYTDPVTWSPNHPTGRSGYRSCRFSSHRQAWAGPQAGSQPSSANSPVSSPPDSSADGSASSKASAGTAAETVGGGVREVSGAAARSRPDGSVSATLYSIISAAGRDHAKE